jgi:hypothetical protein
VLGQLGLATAGAVPGVLHELGPAVGGFGEGIHRLTYVQTTDPASWLLLAALAVALAGSLWDVRAAWRQILVLLGLLGVAVTVPVVAAGWFAPETATASALRWGLAIVFLLVSVPLWGRESLARAAARVGIVSDAAGGAVRCLRGAVTAVAVPVVLLTLTTAALVLTGQPLGGPAAGSLFGQLGDLASHGVPLGLVAAGLVGHALRERSPAYAFAAGLVVNLIVTGGYALGVATSGGSFDTATAASLWQRFSITAGAWAVAWFLVADRLRRRDPAAGGAVSSLWAVQRGLAAAGNAVLLGTAALLLAVAWPPVLEVTADFPLPTPWTDVAGRWPGWLALGLALAAGALPSRAAGARTPAAVFGLGGLGLVALLACDMAGWGPGWGYRTLLFGGPACAVLAAGRVGRRPVRWPEDFAPWVGVSALLTAALAWNAAVAHAERLPGAVAVGAASAAAGWVGLRRRRDDWVFVAGLGVHLAASLFVWHRFGDAPLAGWLVPLLQANGLAAAVVALVWGRARPPVRVRTGRRRVVPLIDLQLGLAAAFPAGMLVLAALFLLARPEATADPTLLQIGHTLGGLGLLAALAAWLDGARRLGPKWRGRAWGTFGLLAGAWLACAVARWDRGDWLAYHALLAAWAVAGGVALLAGRGGRGG